MTTAETRRSEYKAHKDLQRAIEGGVYVEGRQFVLYPDGSCWSIPQDKVWRDWRDI